jgi:diguanylate cyclase (GGDEF)-like protein
MSQRLIVQCNSLEFAAGHDALTGVANRATFDQHLNDSIEHCKQHGTQVALIYIDLDGFKPINDTYGHHVGDIVLSTVADRLRHLVRRTDIVARLGGDEFAIISAQCDSESIKPVLDRINHVINDAIVVAGKHLQIGCSLGVALCPDDGWSATELVRLADERMYAAKRQAKIDPRRRNRK